MDILKEKRSIRYLLPFYLSRAASLPFSLLQEFPSSREEFELFLFNCFKNSHLNLSLEVSYPLLHQEIERASNQGGLKAKHFLALEKLLLRHIGRSVPFDLSGSVGTYPFHETQASTSDFSIYLETDWSQALPKKSRSVTYLLNPTLIETGNNISFLSGPHESVTRPYKRNIFEVTEDVLQAFTEIRGKWKSKKYLKSILGEELFQSLLEAGVFLPSNTPSPLSGNYELAKFNLKDSHKIRNWLKLKREADPSGIKRGKDVNAVMISHQPLEKLTFEEASEVLSFAEIFLHAFGQAPLTICQRRQASWKKEFTAKYDLEEVPLLDLFDNIKGIFSSFGPNGNFEIDSAWQALQVEILAKNQTTEISLTDSHLNRFHEIGQKSNRPAIKEKNFSIKFAKSRNGLIHFHYLIAPPLTRPLARFSGIPEMTEAYLEAQNAEKKSHKNALMTEINHLPPNNLIMIHRRKQGGLPAFQFLAGKAEENVYILPADIRVSLRNNEWILRHTVSGKQVIPILSSMLNPSFEEIPMIEFLISIRKNDQSDRIQWDWGNLAKQDLPRISYKNFILAPRQWLIHGKDLELLRSPESTGNEKKDLLNRRQIPEWAFFGDDDEKRLLHVMNHHSWLALPKQDSYIIQENCFSHDQLNCQIFGRGHLSDITLFAAVADRPLAPLQRPRSSDRLRKISSKCLYYKIYGNRYSLEIILKNLREKIDPYLKDKTILKWHFLYFTDNDLHLRLRLFSSEKNREKVTKILQNYLKVALEDGLIQNYGQFPYLPEYTKYQGSDGIKLFEAISCIESELLLKYDLYHYGRRGKKIDSPLLMIFLLKSFEIYLNFFRLSLEDVTTGKLEVDETSLSLLSLIRKHYRRGEWSGPVFSSFSEKMNSINRGRLKQLSRHQVFVLKLNLSERISFFQHIFHLLVNRINFDLSLEQEQACYVAYEKIYEKNAKFNS